MEKAFITAKYLFEKLLHFKLMEHYIALKHYVHKEFINNNETIFLFSVKQLCIVY